MHIKTLLHHTSFSSEYRSTFVTSYRYEMPDKVLYFTSEAIETIHQEKWKGHVIIITDKCRYASPVRDSDKNLILAALNRGTLEYFETNHIFDYEEDYT